jgi:hypothetical protein
MILIEKNNIYIKNIQVEFSLKTGTSTPLFNTKKTHNSDTNTPYCHYFKAKGLFGSF